MNKNRNPNLTENAKSLRHEMTKEERHLWYDFLKDLSVTIHRQKILGNYIVDFYCAKSKLVIELDGSQHGKTEARKKDAERDAYLNGLGITVLRYSNLDINQNFMGVCTDLLKHLPPDTKSRSAE